MKTGINDKIVDDMMRIDQLAAKKIESTLKGDKPFAAKKLDQSKFLWAVRNIGTRDLQELRAEFGDEAVGRLRYEAAMIEEQRNGRIFPR